MTTRRQPGSHNAILVAGSIVVLYLAALIGLGYVGQLRLLESLQEQEQLSTEKQAIAVAYFLDKQQDALAQLGESPQIRAFLAGHDQGDPLARVPGGGAAASKMLGVARDTNRQNGQPAFSRIAFVENNGHIMFEVGGANPIDARRTYAVHTTGAPGDIQIRRDREGSILTLTSVLEHQGKPVGYLAADVDAKAALQPFLKLGSTASDPHDTALLDPQDQIVVAASPQHWAARYSTARESGVRLPAASVPGTGLRIIDLPHTSGNNGFITSPLFIAALALMAVPLFGGVMFLLRLNYLNMILNARYQATTQQRATLRKQKERLQNEINKRVESEQKLAHQANYDQLTGLPNRNLALDRLTQATKWAKRDGKSVLTMFLDLDRFKQVNDSLGHAAGDELLREAAQRLESCVRDSDTVSRLGGDEFLIICPEVAKDSDWEPFAQQILKALSAPFYIGDHEFFVGASIGIAAYPNGGREPHKLLKNADIAMYAAKEQGRNRYCYYDPSMDAAAVQGMRLENNLRHALEKDEFHLVYQPIVEIGSGRIVAVEALLRWTNQELGNVSPETFIPVAEETGLIHDIGEWVLIEACRAASQLQSVQPFRIAVNLSSKQFSRPGRLLDCILYALRESGLMPSQLELEITETILIDDRPEIGELINQLDRIGVRLSIDDFGTGYSALNYLQRFPFDVLKIDRSFTSLAPASKANASLIRAIIAMAHALDLQVVAEGIETREQAGFLLVYHCEFGQGYLYSRPMTEQQLRIHLTGEQAALA